MLVEPKCCVYCTMKAAIHAAERVRDKEDNALGTLLAVFLDIAYRLDRLADLRPSNMTKWQLHFQRTLREEGHECYHFRDTTVDNPLDTGDRPF